MIALVPFAAFHAGQAISGGQSLTTPPLGDARVLIMLVGGVLIFMVAVAVVKGLLGFVARAAEIAVSIGSTVMVLVLLVTLALVFYLVVLVGGAQIV